MKINRDFVHMLLDAGVVTVFVAISQRTEWILRPAHPSSLLREIGPRAACLAIATAFTVAAIVEAIRYMKEGKRP